MAGIEANPFYVGQGDISEIGNNLVRAFTPDKNADLRRAHAEYYGQQTSKLTRENQAHATVSAALANLKPGQAVDPNDLRNAYIGAFNGDVDPDRISKTILGYSSNTGAEPGIVARAWTGAGHATGKDTAFGIQDRERVAARDDAAALNRTATASGIAANSHIQGIRENNAFNEAHPQKDRVEGKALEGYLKDHPDSVGGLFFKPTETPEGSTVSYAPGDPRGATGQRFLNAKPVVAAPGSSVTYSPGDPRAKETPVVANKTLPPFIVPAGADALVPADSPYANSPKVHNDKSTTDMRVSPKDLDGIEAASLDGIGMWDAGAKSANADFTAQYGAKMAIAREAAASEYQASRNPGRAQTAYLDALGIKPGSTMDRNSGAVGRLFGADKGYSVKPPAGTGPRVGATPPGTPPTPKNHAGAIQEAQDAIAKGAPRAAVIQRLKLMGIDPGEI